MARAWRRSGERIGDWELLRLLGKGGNAAVWAARRGEEAEVALKILWQTSPTSEPYKRFRTEISSLERIGAHPGVLPLLQYSLPERPSKKNPAWLTSPLATPIRKKLGDQETVKDVVLAIKAFATTLADLAEEFGMYHRDIKPENLYWLDSYRIGDFGLVDYPEKESLTAEGRWVGPVHYLAPELLQNPDQAKPAPADVYALAKTLWVLLTRQNVPLPGELDRTQPQNRLQSYVQAERLSPLEVLMQQGTAFNPDARPSMRDVADELQAWVDFKTDSPSGPLTVEEVKLEVGPLIKSHYNKKERWDNLLDHVDQFLEVGRQRLEPVRSALEEVLNLPVSLSRGGPADNLPELKRHTQHDPDIEKYDAISLHCEAPFAPGKGLAPAALFGGIAVCIYRDERLLIAGGYAIDRWRMEVGAIWDKAAEVPAYSAKEQLLLEELLVEIRNRMREASNAFAELIGGS